MAKDHDIEKLKKTNPEMFDSPDCTTGERIKKHLGQDLSALPWLEERTKEYQREQVKESPVGIGRPIKNMDILWKKNPSK